MGLRHQIFLKFFPIKALSDQAQKTYIKYGYQGIAYAIDQKVDIIVCAWSGGSLTQKEAALLKKAEQAGIKIFASAGNLSQSYGSPPASIESVIAIAAVDSNLQKTKTSNYGTFIDWSCPGEEVRGATVSDDQSYYFDGGTSAAVAVAAALFSIVKEQFPQKDNETLFKGIQEFGHNN